MPVSRLSALDASFLSVETENAHMHVGWVAVFDPPDGGPPPSFAECRDHIAARMCRAPRFRQILEGTPLGLGAPAWADDPSFDIHRHVVRSRARQLTGAVDRFLSQRLPRDRPLWQVCVADQLEDGRLAVIGKAHHCMVDGIAAVELASLMVDPELDPPPPEPDRWVPRSRPRKPALVVDAITNLARQQLQLARIPTRVARSPQLLVTAVERAQDSSLNPPISPRRHLARLSRGLEDLLRIKRGFDVKLNDVVLAVCAGGVRAVLRDHDERPIRLKAMVPVNVRDSQAAGQLGNRISFMFVDLPCDEPDSVRRLREIHMATAERKRGREAEGADDVVRTLGLVPAPIRRVVSRFIASPRTFNLTVSNIPGPREPLYMAGCRLAAAYPVVPIADRHALSIGMTTVGDGAHFGIYADPESFPQGDVLAAAIDRSIDELLDACSVAGATDLILA